MNNERNRPSSVKCPYCGKVFPYGPGFGPGPVGPGFGPGPYGPGFGPGPYGPGFGPPPVLPRERKEDV